MPELNLSIHVRYPRIAQAMLFAIVLVNLTSQLVRGLAIRLWCRTFVRIDTGK